MGERNVSYKYDHDDFGLWLDENNIVPCFVNEDTPFYDPRLENLFSFMNHASGQRSKRYLTRKKAIQSNPGKELIFFPLASHVDWAKYFANDPHGHKSFNSMNEVLNWIESANSHLDPWVTEILYNKEEYNIPDNDLKSMVSVANGVGAVHKACLFPDIDNFFFIDISDKQLEYTNWVINNWDGKEPFHLFQKKYSGQDIIENRQWMIDHFNWSTEETQDALIRMRNATYIQQDIIPYKHFEPAVYVVSNAIKYWTRSLDVNIYDMLYQETNYAKDKEIVIVSHKNLAGTLL